MLASQKLESPPRPAILIVDDNRDFADLLAEFFVEVGYAVTVAHDGRRALELLAAQPLPSCIILDNKMPGMPGTEVLARMQEMGVESPVVVVTAFPSRADRARFQALGARAVLSKPVKMTRILEQVSEIAGAEAT